MFSVRWSLHGQAPFQLHLLPVQAWDLALHSLWHSWHPVDCAPPDKVKYKLQLADSFPHHNVRSSFLWPSQFYLTHVTISLLLLVMKHKKFQPNPSFCESSKLSIVRQCPIVWDNKEQTRFLRKAQCSQQTNRSQFYSK